jgi:Na+/H+ antiporter NhaD/arsenite permease-like protein
MPLALTILLLTFVVVAMRKFIHKALPIWAIMSAGALAVLVFHQITPAHAFSSIEPNVMLYLLGIFLIAEAAEASGYLEHLTDWLFFHAHTGKQALIVIVFVLGISTALLMNDTVAMIGAPIILQLCRKHKNLLPPLLLGLAFAVTIGSTMSPVGNPQNVLVAVKSDMTSPFVSFFTSLAIPTLISLMLAYFGISFIYRDELHQSIEKPIPQPIMNPHLVRCVKLSLVLLPLLLVVKIVADIFCVNINLAFGSIALVAALPLSFTRQRWQIIKHLDWGTLIFFASTFVLMQSVWDSGFLQANINTLHIPITQLSVILILSVVLSQFISNVPLVALYLPLLMHHHVPESHLLGLAVGSTLAGNILILGAASTIIIIQQVEKKGSPCFGYLEFLRLGIPLTLLNLIIYYIFL